MRTRRLAVVTCLVSLASILSAEQGRPRITVVPLNPESVSRADATACTGLLEAALVKTQSFDVLEQNQVEEILSAQERSIADCTDESCAIEFGKLLAAEQIVLGSISASGGRLFLTAKIIDVATGRNLKADSVDAASVSELTGKVELLGYKLAGLTYQVQGEERIAQSFGEVFVETTPSGAEVLVNGVARGKSPLLLDRVPTGRVLLEARTADLSARREADVTGESLLRVSLELGKSEGNLFVRSRFSEGLKVFLDGRDVGALGSGLVEKIAAGEHEIALEGSGYYWQGTAVVETGKTVTVEAVPREVGEIEYALPAGVQAEVTAKDYRAVIRESGRLEHVPVQGYEVRASGTDYEPVDLKVAVARGESAKLAPELKHTQAYVDAAKLKELQATREALVARRSALLRSRRTLRVLGWPTLVVGVGGLGLGGASYLLGSQAYRDYTSAVDTPAAVAARGRVETFGLLLNVGAIAGGVGVAAGTLLVALAPSLKTLDARIADTDRAIAALEAK